MARLTARKTKTAKTYPDAPAAAAEMRRYLGRLVKLARDLEDFSDDAGALLTPNNKDGIEAAVRHLAGAEFDMGCLLNEVGTRRR